MEPNPNFNAVIIAAIAVVSALIAAIPSILTTYLTYRAQMRQATKVETAALAANKAAVAAVDVTVKGNAENSATLKEIHQVSNGRLTAALEEIKALQAKVSYLEGKTSQ